MVSRLVSRVLVPIALVFGIAATARAGIHIVDTSGSGGFATVQAAVDAASDGDVILIRGGTYAGFTISGKSLVLQADVVMEVAGKMFLDAEEASLLFRAARRFRSFGPAGFGRFGEVALGLVFRELCRPGWSGPFLLFSHDPDRTAASGGHGMGKHCRPSRRRNRARGAFDSPVRSPVAFAAFGLAPGTPAA